MYVQVCELCRCVGLSACAFHTSHFIHDACLHFLSFHLFSFLFFVLSVGFHLHSGCITRFVCLFSFILIFFVVVAKAHMTKETNKFRMRNYSYSVYPLHFWIKYIYIFSWFRLAYMLFFFNINFWQMICRYSRLFFFFLPDCFLHN